MAHSLSAKKRIRQNEKRQARNRARIGALKKKVRRVADALLHSELEKAQTELLVASRQLDVEAGKGLIHRNTAARKKSRLALRVNALRQKLAASGKA